MSDLHFAIMNNDIKSVRRQISDGANINVQSQFGYTPLMHAVDVGNKIILKMLLAAKADMNLVDESGRTVWDYARERGNQDFYALLEGAAK
jgi:ankyrin repeat protein